MPTTRGGERQSGEDKEGIDLQQQLVLLRQQVQEMRAQLYSESYTSGAGSGRHRRHASSEYLEGAARRLAPGARLRPIPVFTGKSLGEHREHIQGACTHFEALGELVPGNQISLAANSLSDDALDNWHRLAIRSTTWKVYETTIRSFIQAVGTRMGNALLAIKNCRQKPGQSVRELATYL